VSEFNLSGGVEECEKTAMWRAEVCLKTPDGKQTTLDSGFIYQTKASAEASLDFNMNRILQELKKNGVEILSRNGLEFQ
jgi:hypothetical protein